MRTFDPSGKKRGASSAISRHPRAINRERKIMPLFKKATATSPLNDTPDVNAATPLDRDSPEFFQAWLKQAIAASEAFTPETYTVLAAMRRPRGRLPAHER
jgi:hypothetical protein